MENKDISVAVVSRDPFFLFATRGLLGRDRRARIFDTEPSIVPLRANLEQLVRPVDAIICDVDAFGRGSTFYVDLRELVDNLHETKVICLVGGGLRRAVENLEDMAIEALLAKHDLGYCLHLAIRAVVDEDVVLVTENIQLLLTPGSHLDQVGRVLAPEKRHPDLTNRIEEIVMWRVFVGLDNPDIQDELLLGNDTIRKYVSKAYKALGVSGEMEAFDALSDWWWVTRFSRAIRQ
jgi:DNA-binding NarL/FixJ family response regulator